MKKLAIIAIFYILGAFQNTAVAIDAPDCNDIALPTFHDYIEPIYNETNESDYLKLFEYNPAEKVVYNLKKRKITDTYIRDKVELHAPLKGSTKNTVFDGTLYKSRFPGKRPLVMIMPSIKGVTIIEHRLAKYLVKNGLHAFIFTVPRDKEIHKKPATALNNEVKYFTSGTQLWIDYLSKRPFINKEMIGVFATSDGGNRTSIILGYEKRIKAAVLYVAGGNYPKMMTNSEQRIVRNYRKYKMKAEGLTKSDFFNLMKNSVKYDPTYLAKYRNPDDLYMVLALEDTSVPTENQIELWQAFGSPKSKCLSLDHIKGALSSLLEHETILNFYLNKFKGKSYNFWGDQ